jgi:AcrR family transcriptional regulator
VQLGADTARSLVLRGAAVALARKGARETTVEDILAASGISRRTFYRFFEGKDDVMLALYQVGTQGLLTACRAALEQTTDPLSRLERCIDVHLVNARALSRLVFVLGGEAQHHESPLHAPRMQAHAELCALLSEGSPHPERDVWVVRALILALEGLVRFALEEGDEGRAVSEQSLRSVKRAMMDICAQLLRS